MWKVCLGCYCFSFSNQINIDNICWRNSLRGYCIITFVVGDNYYISYLGKLNFILFRIIFGTWQRRGHLKMLLIFPFPLLNKSAVYHFLVLLISLRFIKVYMRAPILLTILKHMLLQILINTYFVPMYFIQYGFMNVVQ